MAYGDFTLTEVVRRFGLTSDTARDLFAGVRPVAPHPAVREVVNLFGSIALANNTEKSRSELLIAPVLAEAWRQAGFAISFYSGAVFDVDREEGLNGVADYLFSRGPQFPDVQAPVLVVVEGKNESIQRGFGQCAAEMVAALRMNRREKTGAETVYGCVTIGNDWKFLQLAGSHLSIDQPEYLISQLDQILGILLFMVGHNPLPAATAA